VATFYHQLSDTLRSILLAHHVVVTASQRIFVVSGEVDEIIASSARTCRSLKITTLDEPRLSRLLRSARSLVRSPLGVSKIVLRKGIHAVRLHLHSIKYKVVRWCGLRAAEVVRALVLFARSRHRANKPDILLLTLDDGGNRTNLGPAQEILRELHSRAIDTVVLTESLFVANELRKDGLTTALLTSDYAPPASYSAGSLALPKHLPAEVDLDLRALLNEVLRRRRMYLFGRMSLLDEVVAGIERLRTVRAVLSVDESMATAVAAGRLGRRSGKPWIGHFPILVGRRPDGYYFPADFHLAYGEQLRDHMVEAGVRPETIEVVGSYTYDKHRGRDRGRDRSAVERAFPKLGRRKLVTVLTEVLPAPETELVPILTALTSLPDVHVVLKVHPDDPLEQFEALSRKLGVRYQIDIVKSCDLSQLLGASDLLICAMSSVAIEAAVTGTPTLMCDFSGRTAVINLVREGLCVGCSEPAKLAETVHKLLSDPVTRRQAFDLMAGGIRRFNGPNDGRSAERIVDFVIARAQWASPTEPSKAPLQRAPVEMERRVA